MENGKKLNLLPSRDEKNCVSLTLPLWAELGGGSHLGVLQPHLKPLHGHLPDLLVATRGGQETQEIPGDVIHRLAPVELVAKHVQDIFLHALSKVIVPGSKHFCVYSAYIAFIRKHNPTLQ